MNDILSLADQVNILFDFKLHPDGRSYTLQEVSAATGVSLATISQIRTGRIKNPQLNTVRALGHFFDVPLRFFEARTKEECYAVLNVEKSDFPQLNEIAFRAAYLSPESQEDILTIIRWLKTAEERTEREGLPPIPRLSRNDEPDP